MKDLLKIILLLIGLIGLVYLSQLALWLYTP